MTLLNQVTSDYFLVLNLIISTGLFIHGVCTINHMNKDTPFIEVLGNTIITVGAFAIVLGIFFGKFSNEPQEVLINLGLLILQLQDVYKKKLRCK